ncbi:MAG TPA: hypothetical protein VGA21_11565 [Cyclobacteriaceae bacterium]|jgi:hypothetical protein
MDENELFSFYKWITNIGLVLFVAFSYFFFGPVVELQSDINNLHEQIEIDNATIDNTTNNATKIQLIKANLARAENAGSKTMTLNITRIGSLLFMAVGLGAMVYGFVNIRKIISSADSGEI